MQSARKTTNEMELDADERKFQTLTLELDFRTYAHRTSAQNQLEMVNDLIEREGALGNGIKTSSSSSSDEDFKVDSDLELENLNELDDTEGVHQGDSDFELDMNLDSERRLYNRTDLAIPVVAHCLSNSDNDRGRLASSGARIISGHLSNLSLSGLALTSSDQSLHLGETVELEIQDRMIPFRLLALVVKKSRDGKSLGSLTRYGLRIVRMSPRARSAIERLILGLATGKKG